MTSQILASIPEIGIEFKDASHKNPAKKKRLAPLSVRLSIRQREQLERDAVGMSLNAYVLARLFDERPKRKFPAKHQQAISRALRRLAQSGMAGYLMGQIVAQEEGRLMLCKNEEANLREAYAECFRIRRDLVEALGLEAEYDTSFVPVTKGK